MIAVRKDKKDLIEVTDKSNNPRILGRVRTQKGFVTYQACNSEAEAPYKKLQKRDSKKLFKELQKPEFMKEVDWEE